MPGRWFCRRRLRLWGGRRVPRALPPLLAAAALTVLFFTAVSAQMRPVIRTMAVSRATNLVSSLLSSVVDDCLTACQAGYSDFILIERDQQGGILSLSGDVQACSRVKREVLHTLVLRLEAIGADQLSIPMGTLTGRLLLSGLGPSIRVAVQAVGDVTAAYESSFSAAGVNQTVHRVGLVFTVAVYLVIPGEIVPVTVEEYIPVAETVIVGHVPDTYVQLEAGQN